MKKVFTLIAGALLSLGMSVNAADPELTLSGGSGTQADPYKISTVADILELAEACNVPASGTTGSNAGHYNGVYFVITADIDMKSATEFIGIATAPFDYTPGDSWKFGGHIDGQNHVISNMVINAVAFDDNGKALTTGKEKSRSNSAFIGMLARGGSLRNLKFDATCKVSGFQNVGMAVGTMEAASSPNTPIECVVENIINLGQVDCYYQNGGGIVGKSGGGTYTGTGDAIKFARNHILNCYNAGRVRVNYSCGGGIYGYGDYIDIQNCANVGEVNMTEFNAYRTPGTSQYGGGIVGRSSYCVIKNVFNAGAVTVSKSYAGGITGNISSYTSSATSRLGTVESAVNIAPVTCSDLKLVGNIAGSASLGTSSAGVFINTYYDAQMLGNAGAEMDSAEGINALNTAALTAGTPLTGLDADLWKFTAGSYPVLKAHDTPIVQAFAKAYLVFADGEAADNFNTKATVNAGGKLSEATEGYVLNADGTQISVNPENKALLTGSVLITVGDAVVKVALKTVPKFFEGEGTEASPYLIKSKADLLNLAMMTTNENTVEHYEGVYFKQTADIDLENDKSFMGIAVKTTKASYANRTFYFSGIYDGGNHVIKNLNIDAAVIKDGKVQSIANGSTEYVGFFGTLNKGAVIKNLHLDASCKIVARQYTGSIAGYAYNGTTIENCSSAASIISYESYAGGILGFSEVQNSENEQFVRNCVFTGSIKGNYQYLGGILGWNKGVIENCVNYGSVFIGVIENGTRAPENTGYKTAGGIAGQNYGNIINCLNAGNIETYNGEVGGIVGLNSLSTSKGHITGCINYGIVTSTQPGTSGAIIGKSTALVDKENKSLFANNYFDKQLMPYHGLGGTITTDGLVPMTTKALTEATTLEGVPAGLLTFTNGFYPIPTAMATDDAAKFYAAAYFILPDAQTVANIMTTGIVSTALPGMTATLAEPGVGFSLQQGVLQALPVEEIAKNTLTISKGDLSRAFALMTLPPVLPGEGTEAKPYLIASAADLITLGDFIKEANVDFSGDIFSITADLDFTNLKHSAVGLAALPFQGVVKGNNHTIKNLIIPEAAAADQLRDNALFAFAGAKFKISDLKLVNCKINSYGNTAILVSNLYGAVENITVDETCEVKSLKGSVSTNSGDGAGAIIAKAFSGASVKNCVNNANVTGTKYIGGIVGWGPSFNNVGITIDNCVNNGDITTTATRTQSGPSNYTYPDADAGGIVGITTGRVLNCKNTGNIKSSTNYAMSLGGIVGYLTGELNKGGSTVENASNTGNVSGYQNCGGITGQVHNGTAEKQDNIKLTNCINRGNVTTATGQAGGISGPLAGGTTVSNCGNYGDVTTPQQTAGGISSRSNGDDNSITNCFNAGKVEATGYGAGILGGASKPTPIQGCFNAGDVNVIESNWQGAAGIANIQPKVTDCYNVGNIKGNKNIGGIGGTINNVDLTFTNVYNLGTMAANKAENNNTLGSIVGQNVAKLVITNAFYCADRAYEMDKVYEGVKHLTVEQLFDKKDLGENFVFNPSCLPMIKALKDVDVAKINSVYFTLADGDYTDEITAPITLGQLEGVTWTATNFTIEDGKAVPAKVGAATLTATIGDLSKTYDFEILEVSGIADIAVDNNEADAVYYNLQGVRVDNPSAGNVYIRVIGKKAEKVMVK